VLEKGQYRRAARDLRIKSHDVARHKDLLVDLIQSNDMREVCDVRYSSHPPLLIFFCVCCSDKEWIQVRGLTRSKGALSKTPVAEIAKIHEYFHEVSVPQPGIHDKATNPGQ
jgi:hypothetical protein